MLGTQLDTKPLVAKSACVHRIRDRKLNKTAINSCEQVKGNAQPRFAIELGKNCKQHKSTSAGSADGVADTRILSLGLRAVS